MAKRTRFEDYKDAYENFEFELSDDGILLMRQHTNHDSLVWNAVSHDRMSDAFADVAGDYDIKAVILTGTGANFNADWGFLAVGANKDAAPPEKGWAPPIEFFDSLAWFGKNLIFNLLDVDVPMIAAINGPCNMHSEVPLMCDIVLASEDTYFDDGPHFARGVVPGDGQHIIWQEVIGRTRASYFLLTDQRLTAQQALEWGAVNEVLPKDKVLDRAWELAREMVKRPPLTLRYTRRLFTQNLKRVCLNELTHGIWTELYAQRAFYPLGGGMSPLQRAWDDPDPFATESSQ
jgi:enoyl-CoA hydratase/carnithine racemase